MARIKYSKPILKTIIPPITTIPGSAIPAIAKPAVTSDIVLIAKYDKTYLSYFNKKALKNYHLVNCIHIN